MLAHNISCYTEALLLLCIIVILISTGPGSKWVEMDEPSGTRVSSMGAESPAIKALLDLQANSSATVRQVKARR